MSEWKKFSLTDEEYAEILAASQPVPYLVMGGVEPISPYERAMVIWRRIAEREGVDVDSIKAAGPRPVDVQGLVLEG